MSRQSITRAIETIKLTRNGTLPSVEGKTSVGHDPSSSVLRLVLRQVGVRLGSAGNEGEDQIENMRQKIRIIPSVTQMHRNHQSPSVMRESDYAAVVLRWRR
jgi:hypothetical protein